MSYLLRILLPDRPGSLGALAVALGHAGADIISLDVVERGAGFAVDDIVVEVPHGALPDTLITAAERLPDTRVESIRPYAGMLDARRELELIDKVAGGGLVDDRLQLLVDQAPQVFQVQWAIVAEPGPGGVARLAASPAAPETHIRDGSWLPLPGALAVDADSPWIPDTWRGFDIVLAAAPLGSDGRALLIGRTGGPDFRPSEIARLGYFSGIIGTVLR